MLIDHPAQLTALATISELAGFQIGIFIKVDTGYHRAGLAISSDELKALVARVLSSVEPAGHGYLQGFYSHAGHSYAGGSPIEAISLLKEEFQGLEKAARMCDETSSTLEHSHSRPLVLSVGATPTATSIENITHPSAQSLGLEKEISELTSCIERINKEYEVEIHAGVYPILNLQQLATQASPSASFEAKSTTDLALTILVEVTSLYTGRDSSEALIAAGSLALGREPCKSYSGWGLVSPWNNTISSAESGWIVGRISQEHGILTQDPENQAPADLKVGQKLRVWPNHAW